MSFRTVDQWLLAACDPEGLTPSPRRRLEPGDLPALVSAADDHAVLGALLESLRRWPWLRSLAESDRITAQTHVDRAREQQSRVLGRTLGLGCIAKRATTALAQQRIPVAILKGMDFANRLYPSLALRPYRDVDLLVPREAFREADRALRALDLEPVAAEKKYAADEYGQISYFTPPPTQWSVELHWSLVNSPSQRGVCKFIWDDLELIPGDPGEPWQMTATSLLVLAAVHACIGHRFDSLQQLCDLRQIGRGAAGRIDAGHLGDLCRWLGCVTAVGWSLALVGRVFACEAAQELASAPTFALAKAGWGMLGSETILRPKTLVSRVRRSYARRLLKTAA